MPPRAQAQHGVSPPSHSWPGPDGDALIRARTPEAVASQVVDALADPRGAAFVAWSNRWPEEIAFHPAHASPPSADLVEAVERMRSGEPAGPGWHLLHDDGVLEVAVLYCPGDPHDEIAANLECARLRMGEVLSMQRLRDTVGQLEQSELLQRSLYAIADMAGSDLEMPEMLRGLHRIVSDLMYAENFYITLYDPSRDMLEFRYFVDTVDQEQLPPGARIPLAELSRGLTWYVIHDATPLMGSLEEIRGQVSGELSLRGSDCTAWLGVPMLRDGEVLGALVVQSYIEGACYSTAEKNLLTFVAEHVLTALERKRGQEELERRVGERTAQLAQVNLDLRTEIEERQRGERLQQVLYRIATLAGIEASHRRFYELVHQSVHTLINARNFYIALLSPDGEEVTFPYARDAYERNWDTRRRGRGLTEFVLRTGSPQRVDQERSRKLLANKDIEADMVGAPTKVWLGVPLVVAGHAIGVVAVQDYDSSESYSDRDIELLTFVAQQVASSLQRRRAAEQLQVANNELEQRVRERTVELQAQIRERERIEASLKHQVMHDPLTDLPNRAYLRDQVERAISLKKRNPAEGFALLYVDIDRFKVINDSLGHQAGDAVLKEMALRMAACVREPDLVARLSGDEFAMLICDTHMPETASKVAQRLLGMLERPVEAGGRVLQLSASVGISVIDSRYSNADQVLHDADLALYRAKESGRNRFELFDEVMHRNAMEVLDLEQGMRDALGRNEFEPYFQPLVRLSDGAVQGYEALLRWNHPERGMLAPGAFLGVAEESGLIEAIDWQMFERALEAGKALAGQSRYVSLNASPRLFHRGDFDQRLLALTDRLGFDPRRLRIEVTEGSLLRDPEAMVGVLQRLADAGVEAALDDFGTGYSSLGHVHRFALRMIKIDRSFVIPFEQGAAPRRSSALIEAILALGRALDVEIMAEGIETPAQSEALQSMGCVFGQGYLFGRPAPAAHWMQVHRGSPGRRPPAPRQEPAPPPCHKLS